MAQRIKISKDFFGDGIKDTFVFQLTASTGSITPRSVTAGQVKNGRAIVEVENNDLRVIFATCQSGTREDIVRPITWEVPDSNCAFTLLIDQEITPTATPNPTSTPAPTPTATPNCNFDITVN